MPSRKTSTPKPAKPVVKPKRTAKAVVKDLQSGLKDLRAIDPEHPWAVLLKEAVAAIRDDHANFHFIINCVQERLTAVSMEATREHREGRVQILGELEQIRTHLARFLDAGIRERGRDERIEAQLVGINERLKERSRADRVIRHGKTTTAEALSMELDAMERAKDEQICGLAAELGRVRAELEAARDPIEHWPLPPPRKSWRTTAAENATVAPLD